MSLPNARIRCSSKEEAVALGDFLENKNIEWGGSERINVDAQSLTIYMEKQGAKWFVIKGHLLFYSSTDENCDTEAKRASYCKARKIDLEFFDVTFPEYFEMVMGCSLNPLDEKTIDFSILADLL